MGLLEGKVAVVTGAARGQGRSHCVRLAEEGADIIALDSCVTYEGTVYEGATEGDLAETERLVNELGRGILAAKASVQNWDELRSVVDEGASRFGRIDILAANAGVFISNLVHEISEAEWTQMIDINLSGSWRSCKAVIPHMIAGGRGGSLVLTSSGVGLRGSVNMAHYVAAKHGVTGLARALAVELGPHSIRANSIHPTFTNTAMIQSPAMWQLFTPGASDEVAFEAFKEAARNYHPLPVSWVEPRDISEAVLYLASDAARFVTGVALPVDCGILQMGS